MNETIAKLQKRIQLFPPTDCQSNLTEIPRSPVSRDKFEQFETKIGAKFPLFLRLIYTEVANGGFGPAWGLNPLMDSEQLSILQWSQIMEKAKLEDVEFPWPDHLIRIGEIGCNMYFGVDVSLDPSPVYAVDPTCGSKDLSEWLRLKSSCVVTWFDSWAEKQPRFDEG